MARSRNLKPGFFHNEILADCDPLARLLFVGLWTIADREGRLECRPRKIKVECLPYDNCDIPALLKQLLDRGFIVAYEVEKTQYIQIVNFSKHQSPHVKEPASTIPAPDKHQTSTSVAGAISPSSLFPLPDSSSVLRTAAPSAALPDRPVDLKAQLWRVGKSYLGANGVDAKQAGSLLGKWRKQYGDHAVIDALAQAETCAASEPIAYIEASLRKRGSNGHAKDGPATALFRAAAELATELEQSEASSNRNPAVPLLGRH